jgi:hypothetical protein
MVPLADKTITYYLIIGPGSSPRKSAEISSEAHPESGLLEPVSIGSSPTKVHPNSRLPLGGMPPNSNNFAFL